VDTCPKNDVILLSKKGFCALGLGLAEIRLNTFSVKHPFGKVYWIHEKLYRNASELLRQKNHYTVSQERK